MRKSAPEINYSRTFNKQLKKAPLEIKIAFRRRFALFLKDPFHPFLNNHALTGKLAGYRSINVTGDWRAWYSQYESSEGSKVIIFEVLGTHSQLYK